MKNVIRVIAASLLVASMAACTKKQEVKPSEEAPPPPVTETAPVQESGQYTRDSLDTDSCLRQRVMRRCASRAAPTSAVRANTTSASVSVAATPCRAR